MHLVLFSSFTWELCLQDTDYYYTDQWLLLNSWPCFKTTKKVIQIGANNNKWNDGIISMPPLFIIIRIKWINNNNAMSKMQRMYAIWIAVVVLISGSLLPETPVTILYIYVLLYVARNNIKWFIQVLNNYSFFFRKAMRFI